MYNSLLYVMIYLDGLSLVDRGPNFTVKDNFFTMIKNVMKYALLWIKRNYVYCSLIFINTW